MIWAIDVYIISLKGTKNDAIIWYCKAIWSIIHDRNENLQKRWLAVINTMSGQFALISLWTVYIGPWLNHVSACQKMKHYYYYHNVWYFASNCRKMSTRQWIFSFQSNYCTTSRHDLRHRRMKTKTVKYTSRNWISAHH